MNFDITKIPKTVIWVAISIFVILLLSLTYLVVRYKVFKPYQQFVEIECTYTNNTAIVILSAKQDLRNVTISDFFEKNHCQIQYISKDSMDGCGITTEKTGDVVYVKVAFSVDNKTYKAITGCKIKERKGLLDILTKR
ncbi:MAG TPA: hypothetical protein EYH09_02015 [Candidatus Nanopusillus sp.]|nr:hypothetical protein [Candidatus Nanopusillus sp.]